MYKRIKILRENNNFSKVDIANLLNISIHLYSQYEDGIKKIPIQYLSILARKYNTSIDYIVGDTDILKPHKKNIT